MDTRPILVVEDDLHIQRLLCYTLRRAGHTVETASDGEEGLSQVRATRPSIVLLDVMMPRMDGHAVCSHIRKDPSLDGTYVIMLSAKGISSGEPAGDGADEYLTKPFSPRELADRVRQALDGPCAQRAAAVRR